MKEQETNAKKKKISAYFSSETEKKLNEMYTALIMMNNKTTRSELIANGIDLLHKKTFVVKDG